MKNWFWLLMAFLVGLFMSALAFAAVDPAQVVSPDAVNAVLAFIGAIPKVGPIIVTVVSWLGLIAGVLTVLSAAVQAFLSLPEIVARWAGAHDLANKISAISGTVLPWLKYLSMFNVQKKQA